MNNLHLPVCTYQFDCALPLMFSQLSKLNSSCYSESFQSDLLHIFKTIVQDHIKHNPPIFYLVAQMVLSLQF